MCQTVREFSRTPALYLNHMVVAADYRKAGPAAPHREPPAGVLREGERGERGR